MIRTLGGASYGASSWSYTPTGGAVTAGSAPAGTQVNWFSASGGIGVSGGTKAAAAPPLDGRTYVFRVEGKCMPLGCAGDPFTDKVYIDDPSCSGMYVSVVNVYASDLRGVCRQLVDRNLRWPIKSVQVFSRAANDSDVSGCNTLMDVTSMLDDLYGDPGFCDECCDLLFDVRAVATAEADVVAFVGKGYVSDGDHRLTTSGSASASWALTHSASGGVGVFGGGFGAAPKQAYSASGGVGVSGTTTGQSETYNFIPGGGVTAGGFAGLDDYRVGEAGAITVGGGAEWRAVFLTTSQGGIVSAGSTTASGAGWVFEMTPAGRLSASGSPLVGGTNFLVVASGVTTLGGTAPGASSSLSWMGLGGVTAGGHALPGWVAGPAGGVSLAGAAVATVGYGVFAGGGVATGGVAVVAGQQPSYNGSSGVRVFGAAGYSSDALGAFTATGGGSAVAITQGVAFSPTPVAARSAEVGTITLGACCPVSIPEVFGLRHNLLSLDSLAGFVRRNGLSLAGGLGSGRAADYIRLGYRSRTKSWQGNVHLAGYTTVAPQKLRWDLTFEMACVAALGGFDLSSNAWRFTMQLSRKNLSTGEDLLTKLVVAFPQEAFCPSTVAFSGMDFTFNTRTLRSEPEDIQAAVFFDDSNVFRGSAAFRRDPRLRLSVRPLHLAVGQDTQSAVDLSRSYDSAKFVLQGV